MYLLYYHYCYCPLQHQLNACKTLKTTDELEADPTEAQQLPDSRPARSVPGGYLGIERVDEERIQELLATQHINDAKEIVILGEKLRSEQDFLKLQRELGDEVKRIVGTQDRIVI